MRASRHLLDHYRVLGIGYNATHEEIKTAFRSLAKAHHPDANPGNPGAVRQFQAVAEAHAVLSDASLKSAYDMSIGNLPKQQHTRRVSTNVTAPSRPPKGPLYDYQTWNDWHYGDNGYARNATQQIDIEPGTPRTKAFFARKVRTTQERKEAQELNAIRAEKDSIVRRLKARRATRRREQAASSASESNCTIS